MIIAKMLRIGTPIAVALMLASCMSNGKTKLSGKIGNVNTRGGITSTVAPFSIPEGAVVVVGGEIPQFKIDLITGIQGIQLGNFCAVGGGSPSTCRCVFRWSDSGVPRGGFTYLNSISTNTLHCNVPTAFTSTFEMPNGTEITIDVTGDSDKLLATGKFVKGTIARAGGRADQNGSTLFNVSHYSCYEKFQRPTKVLSAVGEATDQQGNAVKIPYANNFCYRTMSGQGGAGDAACQTQDLADEFSVQSFYYNLYTNNAGAIHSENLRYTCPKIKNYSAVLGGVPQGVINTTPTPSGASAKHWPLDSTFALADNYSATYPVGVSAPSLLGSNQTTLDADLTKSEACLGQTVAPIGEGMQDKAILQKCLGYAKRPEANGACLPIQVRRDNCVPSGADNCLTRTPTFRLRRYYALYPPTFDTNGAVFKQPTAVDVTYILDRCVSSAQGGACTKAIAGPKPCPFAWYDRYNVVNPSSKKYYGTNYAGNRVTTFGWAGTNPDGTRFPNFDGEESCSALLPVIERGAETFDFDKIFFATTHVSNPASVNTSGQPIKLNSVYIRPMQPWAPHYVEDTEFQACAPASFNAIDPPIYLTLNTVNPNLVGWCTAAYPTNAWGVGETKSPTFAERMPPEGRGDLFRYRKMEISNPMGYDDPPLLAPLEDITQLLRTNSSYACQITQETRFDGTVGPPLTPRSPNLGGCCTDTVANSRTDDRVHYLAGGTTAPCLSPADTLQPQ